MYKTKKIVLSFLFVLFALLSVIAFNIKTKASNDAWFDLDMNINSYMTSNCIYETVDETYWTSLGYDNFSPFEFYNTPSQAVASYLGYLDDIKNSSVITNSLYKGANNIGVSNYLKSYLLNYLPGIPNDPYTIGTEPNHPSCGFDQYLIDNNKESLSCDMSWETVSTYLDAKDVIDSGKPFIIYAAGNTQNSYKFAAGICFGYSTNNNNSTENLLIHTLFSNYYGFINSSYFFKGYYVTNVFSTLDHVTTAVPIIGAPSTGHTVYCTECNHYSYSEGHTYVPFGMTKYRCVRCHYVTTNTGNDPIISSHNDGD